MKLEYELLTNFTPRILGLLQRIHSFIDKEYSKYCPQYSENEAGSPDTAAAAVLYCHHLQAVLLEIPDCDYYLTARG